MFESADNTVALTTCPQCGAPVTLPAYADLAICPYCGSNLRRAESSVRVDDSTRADDLDGANAGASGATGGVEQVLHSVSCPQCAGPLSVRAGRRILLCSHCGVRVLVRGDGGVSRWLLPQAIDRLQALGAATKWLSDHPGISRQARTAQVSKGQLVHVPIWEHRVLVAGWEFGTKLRTRSFLAATEEGGERLDLEITEEPFEEPRLQERRLFKAACDLNVLGATRPRFSGRELLLPLVAGEVDPSSKVLDPERTAAEVSELGRAHALQPTAGAADPESRMLILRESLALLYYPLWLVDYQVGGRPYRIVVDGRDGSVNSAVAPAGDRWTEGYLGLKVAGLIVAAVLAVWLGSLWGWARVPSVVAAVIVVIAAVTMVLRSPRGGKVEYHEPFSS
jgi:DNA-directed RNA polymerase subunit RPC12/RpoP